ncbi:SDR family oxidoreductase [Streptomyces sp. Wb2n-11]|uniref:SDR family oxidoreductase n=1 Tax=Streptomyces sp. Wb2n-11 TaxID=1030533 RepID=UPI000AAAA177|nr:NAD(P)H-binding protein [Streptomyces sp. Wb2n-11]
MDGPTLVTGGTGTLGRPLVDRLLAEGAAVRVMSRRPRRADDDRPYTWAVCDLASGKGLGAAVEGAETIVHCATNARNDVATTRRLIDAARRAGGPHLVYISIVGVDRVPFFSYDAKLAAERLVEGSGLPWTILRATQFHDLVATMTLAQRRLPVTLVPAGLRFQPVEVTEVAGRLAELARSAPAGRVPDMGGPEVRDARDLAASALRAAGRRRRLVPVRLPGKAFRAYRAGGHLAPDRAVGTVTFEEYLERRAKAGRL